MTTDGSSFWTSGAVPLIEPEFLSSIIAAASDIALVVSAEGTILSVLLNNQDDSFGNLSHWEGRPVIEFLTEESVEKFQRAHDEYMAGQPPKKPLELNHSDNAVWQYPVRYTFHRFGQENAVLLLGRDLRPIAETQQQLVQAQIALEQGYESSREFDARYRVVMANVDDAVVFVSVKTGRIEDANGRAAALLGLKPDALVGAAFASLFEDRSGAELTESLMNATLTDDGASVPVRTSRTRQTVDLYPVLFRAAGQRVLMCRLFGSEATMSSLDSASTQAVSLFRGTTDAIVFMDPKGVALSVNDAFLDLIGATHLSDVVGQSLAEYLARGQIDLGVLLENAARTGQMRVYATRLVNDLGIRVPVEVSATALEDAQNPAVALIMRDVSRLEGVRKSETGSVPSMPEPGRNVMDLIGSASLKEIVAETTDVVEKMCIETAVNLTRNNRVAAAEMLGLSRQSLYVKLRKYGLLSKNG